MRSEVQCVHPRVELCRHPRGQAQSIEEGAWILHGLRGFFRQGAPSRRQHLRGSTLQENQAAQKRHFGRGRCAWNQQTYRTVSK